MVKKNSYSKKNLIDSAEGTLLGHEAGRLPLPPMLMVDRILEIFDFDGKYNKGKILAELDINASYGFLNAISKKIL